MVDKAIQTVQPTAILPFDPDSIMRAATDPEDGEGERYVIMNDNFIPYSTYRSRFHTAWEQSLSGLQVDESIKSQAYSISAAAFAATQYRCLTISQVPGIVVDQASKNPVEWHPLIGFMPYMNRLMWQVEVSLLVWGVCYLKKVYNRYRYPTSLQWLHPEDVNPQTDQYDEVYEYYERLGGVIKRKDMVEIRTFDPDRSLNGKSAYEVAMSRITTERNLVMHAGSFFFNSARPDGILVSKTRLDKDGREKAKKDWDKFKGSKNAWQTFVSGGDWEWIPITIPPVDLAMVELKEDTRKDICAIFRTNGALIGLASVSDPLSAGSTLATVKRSHVETVTLPEYNDAAFAMNEQWLWTDFDDKNYYTLIADEANMPVLSDVTGEISTVSINLTNPLNPVVDYDEARKLMKMPPREGYITRPPDQSLAMMNGTLITVNEGRGFIGHDPFEIDMLKTPDGKLIRRSDLGRYLDATITSIEMAASAPPPQNPLMGLFGGGTPLPPITPIGAPPVAPTPINPYDEFRLPIASTTRSGTGCAITLCFSNDELVRSIQTIIRTQIPDSIAHVWCDPSDFHITLFHCETCSLAQEVELYPVMAVNKPMPVLVKRTATFDQEGYKVLILEIVPPQELIDLQVKIYEKAQEIGIQSTSEYSDPIAWKPHITLAYLDPATETTEVEFNVEVQPQAIKLTRTEYQATYSKDIPPEPKEEVARSKRATTNRVEVCIDFADNNFLRTAQRVLSHWASSEGMIEVQWYDYNTFRMPMVVLENIGSYDTARAMELVSSYGMPRTDTYTGTYAIRDNEIGVTLVPNDDIYNIRNTALVQLDEMDASDQQPLSSWTPFIPLGIVRGDIEDKELFESAGYPLVLSALCLYTGALRRGRWELRSSQHFEKELKNWQQVVTRKGRGHIFVNEAVRGIVADFIRSALETDMSVEEVFTRARNIAMDGLVYVDPDTAPTPEEYAEYWKNYDESKADIGQAWYSYMGSALPEVLRWMETETTPAGIQEVLNKFHAGLVEEWVGTPENPGALYSTVLAGMAAGNDAVVKGISMNPERAKPNIGVEISWDLLSQQALDFARSYAYELIKGIDSTTAGTVQDIFAQWVKSGKPFSDLSNALNVVFTDKKRADQIAQTEGIRTYNRGAFKRWQDVGVKRARWRTVNDGVVCRICRRLNGQVADIAAGWVHPGGEDAEAFRGKIYTDSAHTGCRCFRTPDTSNLMEEQQAPREKTPQEITDAKPSTPPNVSIVGMDIEEDLKSMFKKTIDQSTLSRSGGSVEGLNIEKLEIYVRDGKISIGTMGNEGTKIQRRIVQEGDIVVCYNDSFYLDPSLPKGQGIGARVFADQVEALREMGVSEIRTEAHGSSDSSSSNGYYTWARLGYDAELDNTYINKLPESLSNATRVSDLMKTSDGREWWKQNGSSINLVFDLSDGSISMRILREYMDAKYQRSIRNDPPQFEDQENPPEIDETLLDTIWDMINNA